MRSSLVATRPWDNTNSRTDSEAAYLTVIGNASNRLILAAYVVYKVRSILDALKEAAARGVHIEVLLEPAQASGGTIHGPHSSEALLRSIIPNATFYRPDLEKIRAMHAKFVCADSQFAFITSANVTAAAISRNIELGVMICNGRHSETGDGTLRRAHQEISHPAYLRLWSCRGDSGLAFLKVRPSSSPLPPSAHHACRSVAS